MTETKPTTVEATWVSVFRCESCERTYENEEVTEAGPLYECGNCGTVFNRANSANENHQCPDCNKFGSRMGDEDWSCPEGCEELPEEIEALEYGGQVYIPRPEEY